MHGFSSSSQPPPASGRVLVSRRASDIQAEAIQWLWHQRIALGKTCLMAGPPGLGKSQVTTYIAATVSNGGAWCTGEKCEPGDVYFLSAEDDPADTIRPRLEACGANLDRIHIVEAVHFINVKRDRPFELKRDLDTLEAELMGNSNAKLVIIDPISAYLRGVNSQNNSDVRSVLAPLAKLAADHRVAVVCVTHLNKGLAANVTEPLARVIDSTAFGAAVRTAFLIAQDKVNPDRRLFLPLKSNISRDCPGLAFQIEPHVLPSGIETSRVSWDKRPVTITAAEALTALTPDDDIDDAKEVAEACIRVFDKEKATELRSSAMTKLLLMHEGLGLSDKRLKKRLALLGIQVHRRSDANYYLKADFQTSSHPNPPSSTPP
jgi:AAA domain-containing protein